MILTISEYCYNNIMIKNIIRQKKIYFKQEPFLHWHVFLKINFYYTTFSSYKNFFKFDHATEIFIPSPLNFDLTSLTTETFKMKITQIWRYSFSDR